MMTQRQTDSATFSKKDGVRLRVRRLADRFLSKGFPYIKVELEANVRPRDYSSESECHYCYGSGTIRCGSCGGSGITSTACTTCNGTGISTSRGGSCPDCVDGRREIRCGHCLNGYISCDECNGRGYYENDGWYEEYLSVFRDVFKEKLGKICDCLKYMYIYHDGSVDTEATFTLRVDHLQELPGIIRIFAETCRDFGGCDTENAGLHITLLPGYRYPREEKLHEARLANFKRQVAKLLLGLIYLGSPNEWTRAFEYRDLDISSDVKYSAIYTHKDTCIEYRFFDTCFDRPGYIIRYLELIAGTLRYYSDNPRRFLKLKEGVSPQKSDQILDKGYKGRCKKLVDVFRTDESIARLFMELSHLVKRRSKLWLTCAYRTYTMGLITRQELFSGLAAELKR